MSVSAGVSVFVYACLLDREGSRAFAGSNRWQCIVFRQ